VCFEFISSGKVINSTSRGVVLVSLIVDLDHVFNIALLMPSALVILLYLCLLTGVWLWSSGRLGFGF